MRRRWTASLAALGLILTLGCSSEAPEAPVPRPPAPAQSERPSSPPRRDTPAAQKPPSTAPGQVASKFIIERRTQGRVDEVAKRFDPEADSDWNTEVLSAAASSQLKKLAKLMSHPAELSAEELRPFVSDDFVCGTLCPTASQPSDMNRVYEDAVYSVHRWAASSEDSPSTNHSGANGLHAALSQLLKDGADSDDARATFKVFRIEVDAEAPFFTTQALSELSYRRGDRAVQRNAKWRCRWKPSAKASPSSDKDDGKALLVAIDLLEYEEVVLTARDGRLFADYTESVLGHNASYKTQILPGMNHWLTRIPRTAGVSIMANHGIAVGDVNGDGLEDLYACDGGGLPNRLYVQNQDGTLTDRSNEAGVDWNENSRAALFIDLDNDGDQDLIVTTTPGVIFAANDGSGRFERRHIHGVPDSFSIVAADYDQDTDLDLYICGYWPHHQDSKSLPVPVPYYDANNGGRSVLLRNDGEFRFVDVTSETGLDQNNTRYSFAAAWEDYDNDGDLDLYVANDFGRNNLYRNDLSESGSSGPRFTDVAATAGVEDAASGMSVTWGDYNRDGWMDVYISNMFSSAGERIAYQPQFAPDRGELAKYAQRMARGNTMYLNRGDGTFEDVTDEAAVTMGRWAWASKFADLNNDGWLDLVVTNGYFTSEDPDDL